MSLASCIDNKKIYQNTVIKFENSVHDFKNVQYKDKIETVFVFKNIGVNKLFITKVKVSCGCTIPTWPNYGIKPGESGSIKVVYDSSRIGHFNKTVSVFYNGEKKIENLSIKGFVEFPEDQKNNYD
ncbi:hypothetical protein FHR24_003138 [Wenyingzhuangia heitensis]|uniref:DUF1573 domain-containing protein n=1 Tax=Wenyingzhuangia heitensis TaxID=1487859 RepID=A0ABX0UD33_9FLAO|nr:DUF1573 domain-containing protein [Wenyingzhuangia heitensis]NIJ46643.1 hypothetical protein [Wenyingzhuangia heitensis]